MKLEYCVISLALLGASFYTMLTCKQCQPFLKYQQSLNPIQQKLYQYTVYERTKLYVHGMILGILLASVYLYFTKGRIEPIKNSCIFTSIILTVQYLYYSLAPKKLYMLNILTNKDQVNNWLDVYKTMKFRYHMGLLLGIIGFFMLSYGITN